MRKFVIRAGLLAWTTLAHAEMLPAWVNNPPSLPEKPCTVGSAAISGTVAQALGLAGQAAKVELLLSLRTSVKSTTSTLSAMATSQDGSNKQASAHQRIEQSSLFETQAQALPGLAISQTYSDLDSRTAYALACLDVPAAESDVRQRFQQQVIKAPHAGQVSTPKLETYVETLRQGGELAPLVATINLLGSRMDAKLGRDVRTYQAELDKHLATLKAGLSFTSDDGTRDTSVLMAIKAVVLAEGFRWGTRNAGYTIRLQPASAEPADISSSFGMTVVKSSLELSLLDSAGRVVQSTLISGKGVGAGLSQAQGNWAKQCREGAVKAVTAWLHGGGI